MSTLRERFIFEMATKIATQHFSNYHEETLYDAHRDTVEEFEGEGDLPELDDVAEEAERIATKIRNRFEAVLRDVAREEGVHVG